jgi:hypothetical protein
MPIVYINDIDEVVSLHLKTIEVSGGGTTGISKQQLNFCTEWK